MGKHPILFAALNLVLVTQEECVKTHTDAHTQAHISCHKHIISFHEVDLCLLICPLFLSVYVAVTVIVEENATRTHSSILSSPPHQTHDVVLKQINLKAVAAAVFWLPSGIISRSGSFKQMTVL